VDERYDQNTRSIHFKVAWFSINQQKSRKQLVTTTKTRKTKELALVYLVKQDKKNPMS
jgi:hypothetical protein